MIDADLQHVRAMIRSPRAEVDLRCPRCRADVDVMSCDQCGFEMWTGRGVVHALPPERAEHYARFIRDYEAIRAAEGRGSEAEEYYLGLPYKDASGRNNEQWYIRAKSFEYLMKKILVPKECGPRVLDLGAGNCWMSFRLARAGYEPVAVDLLMNEHDGLAAAGHYDGHLPWPIPRFQAEMTRLPFRDEQFDAIVFNASFHYSEDYEATLREALRCLRTGGQIIIIDTPWYSREESGHQMIAERRASFMQRYGTASDSIRSLEFLTDARLSKLETLLSIGWTTYSPNYGFKWNLRPFIAKLRGRREPSRFSIYVTTKDQ